MTRKRDVLMTALVAWSAIFFATSAHAVDTTALPALLRIEMKPRVQVAQKDVTLADIAQITSADLGALRRAMAVPLGTAPRVGDTVSLERAQLQRWLRGQTGIGPEQVKWSGAPVTEVSRMTREIAGDELLTAAGTALRKHLEVVLASKAASRIELHAVTVPQSFVVPAADTSLVVRPLAKSILANRMVVWIDAFANGQYVRSVAVRFEVGVYVPAAVAQRTLPAGSSLQAADWHEAEVDLARVPNAAAPSLAASQRLSRSLRSGDIITHAHLEPQPAVSRGDWANLTAINGLVALESRVEVMQDGQVGQVVRVKPANSVGTLIARVTGPGSLEMQP